MVKELLPPEVIEQETDQDTTDDKGGSQVVYPAVYKLNKKSAGLSTIQPVPTQLLTVSDHNNRPLHLELDSAATVNYIMLDEARARNFNINRNNQVSKLSDGDTTLMACGEIKTISYRDDLPLTFQALVCCKLHCPIIGGTLFLKTNSITQDFTNNTISLLHNRKIVQATTLEATFPVSNPYNPLKTDRYNLMSVKTNKIILPCDSINLDTTMPDQTALVEG